MLVVTTDAIRGWEVQRMCGEVFGISVREPGPDGSKELAASRTDAIARMLDHVREKGGNAVVGLRFDSTQLGPGRSEVCAYGTAVIAAPMDDGARQVAARLGYGQPAPQAYPGWNQQHPGWSQPGGG